MGTMVANRRAFKSLLREMLEAIQNAWNRHNTIMYAGWIPTNPEDRAKWRQLGLRGEMIYSAGRIAPQYAEQWAGALEHCEATPKVMQRLIEQKALPDPMLFTAYWIETDTNLPRDRQLWGGASVQGL